MARMGIYKITNTATGIFYIGSSYQLKRRFKDHINRLNGNRHDNQHLQSSWNKYGQEVFTFETIEEVKDRDLLMVREQYWIDKTQCYKRGVGFNIARFADTNLRRMSEKTILKIANLHRQGVHYEKIAEITGVSIATVHEIKNGNIYREITGLEKIEYGVLNEEDVKNIARICKNATKRNIETKSIATRLSEKYGISVYSVYDINNGRTWGDITGIKYVKTRTIKTKNEVKEVWNAIEQGKSIEYVCDKYNVTGRYINRLKRGEIQSNVTGVQYERSILTEDQVVDIYKRKRKGERTILLAEEYGVSSATVDRIKNRKIWKETTKDIAI